MEERPLECSNCKRKATVFYKEIVDNQVHAFKCCKECPYLQTKLGNQEPSVSNKEDAPSCPECHTSKESFIREQIVGCERCYEVFDQEITAHLQMQKALPQKIGDQATIPLHLGKVPEHTLSKDLQKRLESLELALEGALSTENYERAASLRDEIKDLQERAHGKERKAS